MKKFDVNEVINYIQNGITDEEGNVHEFGIYDFFKLYNIDILDYFKANRLKLSYPKAAVLQKWIHRETGYSFSMNVSTEIFQKHEQTIVKSILPINIIKNAEFDENGDYIPGSGRVITQEEKELAYNLLDTPTRIMSAKIYSKILDQIALGVDVYSDLNLEQERVR